jgi:hypothetical protein
MPTPLDDYDEAVRAATVRVDSPRGWVTVARQPSGEVLVSLRRDTLAHLTEDELASELQQAFTRAYLTYRDESRHLRRRYFGSDYDEIHTRRTQ